VAALIAGCATDHYVGGTSPIGKVQGVYVEAYQGVFLDRQLVPDTSGKQLWVYVTFDAPLEDGRKFATAMLEQDTGIEPGDLVQLRLAHDGELRSDAVPEHNRVTALIAKHDTAQARAFGRIEASALDALRQAASH
jgi:hypothetical protein